MIFSKTSLRRLSQTTLIWTLLHLSMAVALHWVNPQAIDVLCTRTGKIEVTRKGKSNTATIDLTEKTGKYSHNNNLECPLCIGLNDVIPPHARHTLDLIRFTNQQQFSLTTELPSFYFASLPPPARAPPAI